LSDRIIGVGNRLQGALDEKENEVNKLRKREGQREYLLHDYQLLDKKFY
jgi:hypothetical protein